MRRGFNTLAAQTEWVLAEDPYSGHLLVFRGRRGYLLKIIWWDVQGACLFMKRPDWGRFVWPAAKDGNPEYQHALASKNHIRRRNVGQKKRNRPKDI